MLGWFLNPIVTGDYPQSMRTLVGNMLQKFTKEQTRLLKGSMDFLGLNYHTTYYAQSAPPSNSQNVSYMTDPQVNYLCKS